MAQVLVTTRPVRTGEPLRAATVIAERELRGQGALATLAEDAVAARPLSEGQIVDSTASRRQGAAPGERVKVRVVTGALQVEQAGQIVACGPDRTCAVLPSGRHVEGQFSEGVLLVVAP